MDALRLSLIKKRHGTDCIAIYTPRAQPVLACHSRTRQHKTASRYMGCPSQHRACFSPPEAALIAALVRRKYGNQYMVYHKLISPSGAGPSAPSTWEFLEDVYINMRESMTPMFTKPSTFRALLRTISSLPIDHHEFPTRNPLRAAS